MKTMKQYIRKADIALLLLLLAAAGAIWLLPAAKSRTGSDYVQITVDGKIYGTYDLHRDKTITVLQPQKDGTIWSNTVQIQNDTVTMTEANCKNQVCVDTGTISKNGQSIICLPHQLAVQIFKAEDDSDIDAVVR